LAAYGFEEMHWVARDVDEIAAHDPELVSDIYAAVFGHDEPSTEKTDMGGSRILSLTSNRRQDYDGAKWQLGQSFPRFVQGAPVAAARAMARITDAYASKEHRSVSSTPAIEIFDINGQQASISTDYSYIWDRGGASHRDNEIGILGSFFRHLEELIRSPDQSETVDQVLAVLIRDTRQAVIWARLLRLGALHPAEFGVKLRSLAWAEPVLRSIDTESDAGDFVAAIFPLLSAEERERVEKTILAFPKAAEEEKEKKIAERDRARLLGRLSAENLVTPEAKRLLEELRATSAIPEPTPRRPLFQVSAVDMNETRWVEDVLGVSAESESHKKFLDLQRPVKDFYSGHSNNAPTIREAEGALPSLTTLRDFLQNSSSDVDPKLVVMGYGNLAGAAKVIANSEKLECETEAGQLARSVLLEMSHRPEPEHDPAHDAAFDEHPSWGAPISRIEAAAGLISLARHSSCCGPDVLEAIERLGRDEAPEVRFQIAANLTCLYKTASERMWKFLEDRSQTETSSAVLDALASCLNRLAGPHSDRSAELSQRIFARVQGPGSEDPRATCLHTLVGLYVWQNHDASNKMVCGLVRDARANPRELLVVLSDLRNTLTNGSTEPPSVEDSAVRTRAVELFHSVTVAACDAFEALIAGPKTSDGSEPDVEPAREIARLVDHAAAQLFFASGVFRGGQEPQNISRAQQERFYRELTPTIDRLSAIGLPSAVHHLIEMLEVFVSLDPRKVFLHIAALVESGRRGSYQYEQLAADHIVRIVETYLAEYRSLLQEDADCRIALRQTLDAFVEAGWPAAQRLSYRLDEIFR
jgi:hypothetical protein